MLHNSTRKELHCHTKIPGSIRIKSSTQKILVTITFSSKESQTPQTDTTTSARSSFGVESHVHHSKARKIKEDHWQNLIGRNTGAPVTDYRQI